MKKTTNKKRKKNSVSSFLGNMEARSEARHRKQEEEYGRDEFLFGTAEEETWEEDEYYEDESYVEEDESYLGDDESYDDDAIDDDTEWPEDERPEDEWPEDEWTEDEWSEEEMANIEDEADPLPEYDPDDPDFFTREIDVAEVKASTNDSDDYDFLGEAQALVAGYEREYAESDTAEADEKDVDFSDEYDSEFEDEYDSEFEDVYYADEYSDDEYEYESDYDDEYDEWSDHKTKKSSAKSKKSGKNKKKSSISKSQASSKSRKSSKNGKKDSKKKSRSRNNGHDYDDGFFGGIVAFFRNMSMADRLLATTGVCVLCIAIVAGTLFVNARTIQNQVNEFAEIGTDLNDVYMIGADGINASVAARADYIASQEIEEILEEEIIEETVEEVAEEKVIVMKVSSIQSDLKIKFVDKATDRLISGIVFEVTVTESGGKTYEWKDENKDGLMYHTEVPNGTYKVSMKPLSGTEYADYVMPADVTGIKVTDTIAYKKVDVADEVKKESEVNAAVEDTAVNDTAVESVLTDTVEWVESTKTLIGGSEDAYEEVDKSKIAAPTATSKVESGRLVNTDNHVEAVRESWSMPYMAGLQENIYKPSLLIKMYEPDTGDTPGGGDGSGDSSGGSSDGTPTDTPSDPPAGDTPAPTPTISVSGGGSIEKSSTTTVSSSASGGSDSDKVTWTSSDTSIATVDANGVVTGVSAGSVTITASYAGKTASCTVTVTDNSSSGNSGNTTPTEKNLSASISPGSVTVNQGAENKQIVASASGGSGSYKYEWSTSDKSIVDISAASSSPSATMIFGKAGTATITCTITTTVNGETKTTTTSTTITVNAVIDGTANLKTASGKQVYVKNSEGKFVKATATDYATASKFYIEKEESDAQYMYTGWQTIDGYTYFFDKNGNYVTGEQVIQGAKYTFGSDGHLSSGSGTMGIDVSKWNGSIDWNAVANAGVSYVIIRCGYRGSSTGALIEDPKFRSNISGAKAAGLKVGAYFFTQAVNEVEAVEEASMAINLCSAYGLNLPLFLDVESSGGRADGIGSEMRTSVVKAFCKTVQNSGYTAGVYANKTWFTSYMNVGQLTGYKIWLAQYAAAPTYTASRYDYWQYSSKGSIPGISGKVDLNIKY